MSLKSLWLVINQTFPVLAAVVPCAVPVPDALLLSCAVATKIAGVLPGAAGV